MTQVIHQYLQELESGLVNINARTDIPHRERVQKSLQLSQWSARRLAQYINSYVFLSRKEMVMYFKIFKPRFLAYQSYYRRLVECPQQREEAIVYWRKIVLDNETFAQENRIFYRYQHTGSTTRDLIYFTDRNCSRADFEADAPGFDHLAGRILSDTWLDRYIRDNACLYNSNPSYVRETLYS